MPLFSSEVEETVEFKNEFTRHFILYAKRNYEQKDTVEDLRSMISKISNTSREHINTRIIFHHAVEAFQAVLQYDSNPEAVQRFLSELVSDLMDDFNAFDERKKISKEKGVILGYFIQKIVNYLEMFRVNRRDDEKKFKYGEPDPAILPLNKKGD